MATIIKNAKLCFVHAFTPTSMDGNEANAKYSVCVVIPKSDEATVAEIQKAIAAAKEVGKGKCFNGKIPAGLRTPLRDGDTDRPDDPNFEGCWFFNASSKRRPGVLEPDKTPMTDETHLYSGCYAHVSVNFYPYSVSGNRGIGAGLNNIMKCGEGESLAGAAPATSDFGDIAPAKAVDDFNTAKAVIDDDDDMPF